MRRHRRRINSTYIGASVDCVPSLVSDGELEVLPVDAEQTITFDTDIINPEPDGSYEDSWQGQLPVATGSSRDHQRGVGRQTVKPLVRWRLASR